MTDWTAITEGVLAFLSAGAIGLAFYVKATARTVIDIQIEAACTGKIATLADAKIERAAAGLYNKINDHDHRLTRLETAVADLPRGRDLHVIALQVSEMLGEMKGMRSELHSQGERFKRHEGQLDRLEQWAIEAAKEKAEG